MYGYTLILVLALFISHSLAVVACDIQWLVHQSVHLNLIINNKIKPKIQWKIIHVALCVVFCYPYTMLGQMNQSRQSEHMVVGICKQYWFIIMMHTSTSRPPLMVSNLLSNPIVYYNYPSCPSSIHLSIYPSVYMIYLWPNPLYLLWWKPLSHCHCHHCSTLWCCYGWFLKKIVKIKIQKSKKQ